MASWVKPETETLTKASSWLTTIIKISSSTVPVGLLRVRSPLVPAPVVFELRNATGGAGEGDGLMEDDGETDGEAEDEGDTEEDGLTLTEGDTEGDREVEGEAEALGLTEALGETEGLIDVEGEREAEGERLADPSELSTSAKKTPAVSPVTAKVGLEVSPVDVLILNSPLTKTAAALLRDLATVIAVKFVETVNWVVELASLPKPRK